MYRMLIVEDEEIVREGLRDLFDWDSMGIRVVGAVESAEEALALSEIQDIDILFTDIKLSSMSGLELAEILSRKNPDLKIIISSGYRNFEYAKTAVDLDAYGFLSKPIKVGELTKIVTKILNTCNRENCERLEKARLRELVNQSMPFLKCNFFNSLLHHPVSDSVIAENLEFFNLRSFSGQYTVLVLEMDDYENISLDEGQDEMYIRTFDVQEKINGFQPENVLASFHISGGRFSIILHYEEDHPKNLYEKGIGFAEGLQKRINHACGIHVTIGIGGFVDKLRDIKNSYKEACKALEYKFFMGSNQIINHRDFIGSQKDGNIRDLEAVGKRILSGIELGDRETLELGIHQLFDCLKTRTPFSVSFTRNICIDLLAKVAALLMEMNESFESILGKEALVFEKISRFDNLPHIREWMCEILNKVTDYLCERREGNNKKIIHEILKTIDENYHKNLTIMDISKEVYLSPNYIGIIFKREMGKSFSDYLVGYRLEKAKKLLKETNLKVYQVGSMVGYNNTSYFCSIFKNYVGVSPNEYREKI